ncbi:MAG: Gfo/Idh/MocA family oxidoreductase [Gemmatimonadetes bacterium]|nr:Gfo/Idh/MocA family oxidoreductase [Gemmatimonadota bacterium]
MTGEVKELRVGMLGLGSIAQVVHLPILADLPGVRLTAVCDVDHSKARSLAARFGIARVARDDAEVMRAEDIDAIVICTPNHLHAVQSIAALEAGKHVLVEKPIAIRADDVARVIAAARKSGRTLMVAMNHRYRPDTLALKPFAVGGELGRIFLCRGAWLNRKYRINRPTWRHRKATAGGGALIDLGAQALDLSLWVMGFPTVHSVFCHTNPGENMEVEDTAALVVRLADGGCISLTLSWSLVAERDRHYMRLLGTRGSGAIQPLAVYKEVETGLLDVTPTITFGRENLYTASYRQELEHFVRAIRGQDEASLPDDQIQLMRLIALAYRSAAEKREVSVDED